MFDVINVQVEVLRECIKGRIPVTVFLTNGFQLRGVIINYDVAVILLEVDKKPQMIYKHAISTIAPMRPVKAGTIKTEGD